MKSTADEYGLNEGVPETNGQPKILLPEIDRATALLADETIKLPPQIIQGVLHQGLKAVLGGSSKTRKTWILLDAAISHATGTRFWKWNSDR